MNKNAKESVSNEEVISDPLKNITECRGYYVYEYFIEENQEVFYVGKGKGDRAWKHVRNLGCEKVKSEHKWGINIVHDNLKEEEALKIENDLIEKYREEGAKLTNIMPGNILPMEKDKIGHIKYILFLMEKEVLKLTLTEIGTIFSTNHSTVWSIANTDNYDDIEPLLPKNIDEIIHNYHVRSYTDNQVRIGNIKYVLDLIQKNVLNLTQAELGRYYCETASNISSIKKENTHKNVPLLIPKDIGDLFNKYDVFNVSEEEKKRGMIVFIIRLREQGIIKITNKDIGHILDVSSYLVSEFTRTDVERKYNAKEYRPNARIMAKLSTYFIVK